MIADEQAVALAHRWAHECQIDGCDAHHCPRCGDHTFGRCSSCDACDIADENGIACGVLADHERASLFAWVRERRAAFEQAALSGGAGVYEPEPSREDFAEWVGLDLGEPFESNAALTEQLLEAAEAAP